MNASHESKVCPKCAEVVMAAAQVCRFCGHRFDTEQRKRGMVTLLGGLLGGALLVALALTVWVLMSAGGQSPKPSGLAFASASASASPGPQASLGLPAAVCSASISAVNENQAPLAGAGFVLYLDTNANQVWEPSLDIAVTGQQFTDSLGSTLFLNLPCAGYFVLETAPPPGYAAAAPAFFHAAPDPATGTNHASVVVASSAMVAGSTATPYATQTAGPAVTPEPVSTPTPSPPPASTPTLGPTATPTATPPPLAFASDVTVGNAAAMDGIDDLAATGATVTVAWDEDASATGGSPPYSTWVSTSTDAGQTWGAPYQLAMDPHFSADGVALAADPTNGATTAVWSEEDANGDWSVWTSSSSQPGQWSAATLVSEGAINSSSYGPRVAFAGQNTLYTYTESSAGAGDRAMLRVRDGQGNLGPAEYLDHLEIGGQSSLTATDDTAFVAWIDDAGKVRLRRGTLADGGTPSLSWTQRNFGAGSFAVRVTADGQRAVIAWERNDSVFTSYSTDGGASWSKPVKTLDSGPQNDHVYGVVDLAIAGQMVVLTVGDQDSPFDGVGQRVVSGDGGASWQATETTPFVDERRQVVFLQLGGSSLLAEAWNDITNWPPTVKFHLEQ